MQLNIPSQGLGRRVLDEEAHNAVPHTLGQVIVSSTGITRESQNVVCFTLLYLRSGDLKTMTGESSDHPYGTMQLCFSTDQKC